MSFYPRRRYPRKQTKAARIAKRMNKKRGAPKTKAQLARFVRKVVRGPQETKWINQRGFVDAGVGQTRGLFNTGWLCADITPTPSQGPSSSQRIGQQIHLTGAQLRLQFKHQANTAIPIKFKVYIVAVKATPITSSAAFASQFLLPDVMSGATDFNSRRNPDYFRSFKVLAQKNVYLPGDNYGGQNVFVADKSINLKLNHMTSMADGTTTTIQGQIYMIVVADNGNCDAANNSAAAFPQVANPGVNTGALLNSDYLWYYTDS